MIGNLERSTGTQEYRTAIVQKYPMPPSFIHGVGSVFWYPGWTGELEDKASQSRRLLPLAFTPVRGS